MYDAERGIRSDVDGVCGDGCLRRPEFSSKNSNILPNHSAMIEEMRMLIRNGRFIKLPKTLALSALLAPFI